MNLHKKLSLFHYFHIVAFILFLTFASIFVALSFYNATVKFEKESQRLQKEYSGSKKKMLITEVDRFIEHIEEKRQEAYAQRQQLVKARVYEAYEIANKLYQTYHRTHSDAQIATMIVDTLRLLRYENNQGYYFITHLDGTEILFADRPELEGQNMLTMANSEGAYIVKGMLDVIQSTKEGFYDYAWSKPFESKDTFKKVAYVKLFEPLNWMIGTGFYLDDLERNVQEKILNDEKRLLVERESGTYLFIGTWDGISLSYPAKNKNMYALQDSNGKFIVQELIEKAKKGGGFVEYMMPSFKGQQALPKMSYVESIDDWQWYVGAGIYLDDLNHELYELKMSIDEELKRTLYSILFWMLMFSVVVGGFYLIISRKIRKDFDLFITFFDSLVNQDQLIDTSNVKFKEFEELANHANAMLRAKIFSNKHLEQYKKIVSSSDDFLALIDRNYIYLAISEAYQKFFNKRKEEILGHSMPELYGAQYFVENLKHLSDRVLSGETFEHEFWALASFGKRFLHTKYFPYYENEDDPLPMAYVVSARDNTEKKANEERLLASEKELEFLAHNDTLTGLPNRLLLTDRIAHAIENSKRQGGMIAVCFLDLDNFKKINDSYGHSYGDEILKQLALRLQGRIRHCDTLSRIGSDEFILLVENIKEKHEIEVIIAKIQAIFEEPFINKAQKFFLSASIGVSVYPDHGTDGETLIKKCRYGDV